MSSDPEELLRSIERTREELALTVDTIAGRLDPKTAAKRGVGKLRDGVTGVVDGVRARFDHHTDHVPEFPATADGQPTSPDAHEAGYRVDKALASASSAAKNASSAVKDLPKPVIGGGLAALVALAAILYAANRRQRR
jgi:hypothetical protein